MKHWKSGVREGGVLRGCSDGRVSFGLKPSKVFQTCLLSIETSVCRLEGS